MLRLKLSALASGRTRTVLLGGASSFFARSVAILTLIVTVPLASRMLDPSLFGLWSVVAGFGMILTFADAGIGAAVISESAAGYARRDNAAIAATAANGLAAMLLISLVFLAASVVLLVVVDWPAMLGASDGVASEQALPAVACFALLFTLQLPLGLAASIQLGMQKAAVSNLITMGGNLASFAGAVAALLSGASVPVIICATMLPKSLASVGNNIVLFGYHMKQLRPSLSMLRADRIKQQFQLGFQFLLLTLGASALIRFDSLIVANANGIVAGGVFAALDRLFAMTTIVSNSLQTSLWPAYKEALITRQLRWVNRAFFWATLISALIVVLFSAALVIGQRLVVAHWIKVEYADLGLLFVAVAVQRIGESTFSNCNALLTGADQLRPLTFVVLTMAAVGLAIKMWGPWSSPEAVALIGGGIYLAGAAAAGLIVRRILR